MKVSFVIPGPPKGKGRPRFARVGNYVRTYTPDSTESYEELIRWAYKQARGGKFEKDVPIDVRVFAYYPIPESASKKKKGAMIDQILRPTKKPDFDNVGKCVADAVNKIAYHDDAQIVDFQFRKFYSTNPRVVVVMQDALPITGPVE